MVSAHPAFFASQVVFFVWGAILLGFFVKCLVDEVTLKGWHTSRTAWSCFLCVSSTIFVIDQLDPRTALGLYPPQALKLIEWSALIALTQSIAFAGYVYMAAMYQRNMGSVPPFLRNFWFCFNVVFSVTHLVLGIIGSATDTSLWYGISETLLVIQEIAITTVLNVSIYKLSTYLRQLSQEINVIGGTATNYSTALRKMFSVGVYITAITTAACIFELAAPGHAVDNLSRPNAPILYVTATFSGQSLIYPVLACFLHSLLLYMIRRPQPKSEKNTKESDSGGTRPSTASSWRPSVAAVKPPSVVVDVADAGALPEACDSPSSVVETNDSQLGGDIIIVP